MPGKREGQVLTGSAVARRARQPEHVVILRITWILRLLERGKDTAGITQSVAEQTKKERGELANVTAERAKLLAVGDPDSTDAAARLEDPPTIWGGEDPPKRTLGHYLQKARNILEAEGRHLGKAGNYILGSQWARGLALYNMAIEAGDLTVAARVWSGLNDMFGLHRLKVEISALAPTAEESASGMEETALTEEQAGDELAKLFRRGLERRAEEEQRKLAAAETAETGEARSA